MILNIIIAIVAVAASTGLFTWAIVWWVQSSTSKDTRVRFHAWLVEILMNLAVVAMYAAASKSPKERKLALITLAVVIAVWSFRGTRYLIARRKA